jgi:hypothetical protein
MQLNEKDIALVNSLVTRFYDVVPHEYKTFCAFTARITQSVLMHFGIDARLLPCQVWLVTDKQNYVVGFLGESSPGKWNGHVVCSAGGVIVDAALKHFETEFGLIVPNVISTPCFNVPTQVISRCDLGAGARLWWHYPPTTAGIDPHIPDQRQDLVNRYAAQLIEHLENTEIARDIASPRGTTLKPGADAPDG